MRARNIKPSFFKNDILASCGPFGQLLFIGLWCMADRNGRLEDRPARIKAELLPYAECDVNNLLDKICAAGFIIRYEAAGVRCIQIKKFHLHQRPHPKEVSYDLPAPPDLAGKVTEISCNAGEDCAERGMMNDERGMMNDECGKRNEEAMAEPSSPLPQPPRVSAPVDKDELVAAWNKVDGFIACRDWTQKRAETLRSRSTSPQWVADWRRALQVASQSDFLKGSNERGWRADIDFFLKPNSVNRILEGKYNTSPNGAKHHGNDKPKQPSMRYDPSRDG